MKLFLPLFGLLLAPGARAAAPEGFPAFGSIGFTQFLAAKSGLPAPRAVSGDVISSSHLLAQAGRDSLFGYANTQQEADQAIAYWNEVLTSAGVVPGAASFADGMYRIPYSSPDGRVIRDFLAEPRQFPPKDEAGLRANMALAQRALAAAGLKTVAARVLNLEALLPTYSIYYLTRADEKPEHEARLRVLKPGDDADFGIYREAGVNIVQIPQTWMMVYLGPEVGYVAMAGRTREDVERKLAARRELFASQGKRVIAERVEPLDDAEYKFAAALYFFQ